MERIVDAEQGWVLKWWKSQNGGNPVPDDYYSISKQSGDYLDTLVFLFEKERTNKKGGFNDLLKKVTHYKRVWNTEEARRRFGAAKFYIIFSYDNQTKKQNAVQYLSGVCNCTYWKGRIRHTCLKEPIKESKFWFTTDDMIVNHAGADIFITPKDQSTHSFEKAFA